MNIFVLDQDPEQSAKYLCDKHVIKMILESAQLASTALQINKQIKYDSELIYKSTHINHPCTKWVAKRPENFAWLLRHAFSIGEEYSIRYGKTHKSLLIIDYIYDLFISKFGIVDYTKHSDFVLAMPDKYKMNNPVLSYRKYYIEEKREIAKWKCGNVPEWWNKDLSIK